MVTERPKRRDLYMEHLPPCLRTQQGKAAVPSRPSARGTAPTHCHIAPMKGPLPTRDTWAVLHVKTDRCPECPSLASN